MKHFKLYIVLVFIIALGSCKKDFIDTNPINRYTYYNFPQTEAQVDQAVAGCYRQVYTIYSGYMWIFGDMLSDNTSFKFNTSDRGGLETEKIDEFLANSSEGNIANMYRDSYEGISRSNIVLDAIPKITFTSTAIKDANEGEAKFFRAFHYFNLVRLYGDVPVVTQVILEEDPNVVKNYPRKPIADVYSAVIIPDALDAIAKLPATTTVKGRLTKAAANVLLAKVYMTLNRFSDALPLLNNVTGFSLNTGATGYKDCFDPKKKNGPESIYEIQVFPGSYTFGFTGAWIPSGTGTTIWLIGSNPRGGLNQPTTSLINSYEANDTRRAVTVAGTAPNIYLNKFFYPDTPSRSNVTQWPVYRYADVLLMRAECLNEASFNNGTAFADLNAVRTRAGLLSKTPGNATPALAVNDQAEFRLAIEQERRVELAGEAHRWFDLLRTGRATTVMTAHGVQERMLKGGAPQNISSSAYTDIKLLLGIPFREVQQFGYPQNPGW
jgi:starch-binding outer membrane protein, SusD/RagB family